ncbi:hypothetical protein ACRAWF_45680 [Streptomyces sp. L7]
MAALPTIRAHRLGPRLDVLAVPACGIVLLDAFSMLVNTTPFSVVPTVGRCVLRGGGPGRRPPSST